MDVEVKHVLPARGTVGLEDRHSVGVQALVEELRDVVDCFHQVPGAVAGDVPDVGGVEAGHHQRVPARGRVAVKERVRVLGLVHPPRRGRARHDPAEDAVVRRGTDGVSRRHGVTARRTASRSRARRRS